MISVKSSVVLVDDHPIVLAGLKSIIENSDDFTLKGDASSGTQGLALITETRPDLAVIDLSMPGMGGVELVRAVGKAVPSVMVLVLTVHEEPAYVQQVMKAGSRGYVLKRSAAEELLRALRAVVANGLYIDPAVAAKLLGQFKRSPLMTADLSERELDVMKSTARGFSNKEIASRLEISVKTVETYKARAMEKLTIRTRADLVRYATGQGWLSPSQC